MFDDTKNEMVNVVDNYHLHPIDIGKYICGAILFEKINEYNIPKINQINHIPSQLTAQQPIPSQLIEKKSEIDNPIQYHNSPMR